MRSTENQLCNYLTCYSLRFQSSAEDSDARRKAAANKRVSADQQAALQSLSTFLQQPEARLLRSYTSAALLRFADRAHTVTGFFELGLLEVGALQRHLERICNTEVTLESAESAHDPALARLV